MKWNDKAYEAAVAAILKMISYQNSLISGRVDNESNTNEIDRSDAIKYAKVALDAASAAQFKSEDHKALKKAWLCYRLCEGGGAYDGPFFIKYDPYEENDYDKIEPILYYDATQFQSEDYAGLVKELRDECRDWLTADCVAKAADAIEALLAERDAAIEERDYVMAEGLFSADQIRILKAERDALKAENESMSQSLPLWAHKQMAANSALIERLRAERDALAARFAPVDDDSRRLTTEEQKVFNSALRRSAKIKKHVEDKTLVEIAATAYLETHSDKITPVRIEAVSPYIRATIAAIRPHIEAVERERCAKIADDCDKSTHPADVAAAIRSGK